MYYVVIPAYNAEKSIRRCVESIPKNTAKFSIIIIYDLSIDNTYLEIDHLKSERTDVVVIAGNYGSAGAARNAGLEYIYSRELMETDRILFLDADDLFTENIIRVFEYNETSNLTVYASNQNVCSSESCILLDMMECLRESLGMNSPIHFGIPYRMNTVWGKIFPAEKLANERLFFYSDVSIAEDLLFMLQVYKLVDAIYVSSINIYIYTENQESITHKYLVDFIYIDEKVQNHISNILTNIKMSDNDRMAALSVSRMKGILNIFGLQIFHKNQQKNWSMARQQIRDIQSNKNYQFNTYYLVKYYSIFTMNQLITLFLFKVRWYNILIFLH